MKIFWNPIRWFQLFAQIYSAFAKKDFRKSFSQTNVTMLNSENFFFNLERFRFADIDFENNSVAFFRIHSATEMKVNREGGKSTTFIARIANEIINA